MKKITLLVFALFLSFSAYCQFPNPGVEGFENTTGPEALPSTVWNLGTGVTGNQWAVFDNGVGTVRWGINNAVAVPPLVYAGVNSAYMNRNNTGGAGLTSQNYLATPLITVPLNGQLRFMSRTFTVGNTGTFYDVKWAPMGSNQTDPAAYTVTLATYTEDELTLDSYSGVQNAFNIYTQKIINFPATIPANAQGYIAFVRRNTQLGTAADGDRWLMDDVQLNSRCLDPTTLGASPIACNNATLIWGNPSGASSWEIEVLPAASLPTGVGILYSGTPPYVATTTATGAPLVGNTPYKYYVRAVCPGSIPSFWVGPFNFTTTTCPPVCGGNYVDAGGPTANYPNNSTAANGTTTICPTTPGDQVTVTFTSFNTQAGTDILSIYDGDNSSAPLLGAFSGTAIPPTFTSSAVSGCLTFVFISNATTNNIGWVANVTCGPPPACPKPTALVPVVPTPPGPAITPTSINLGWTNIGPGTSWQYLVLAAGAPAPTAASPGWVATATNPVLINTGLLPGTCYDVYVRADCSSTSNGLSAWSTKLNFCTPVLPPVCGGNFVDAGGPTANYPNNSTAANGTTTICPTNPGEQVTVTFTSFNTQANTDILSIYDGPSSASPLLGAFSGTALPPSFTSSSPSGCLTFVFISNGTTNNIGWLANVTCAPAPPCPRPHAVTATAVSPTSINVAWTNVGPATSWQYLLLACGSPTPTAASTGWVATSTNPVLINTGVASGTCYNVYVRSDCTSIGTSDWSYVTSVTTPVSPPVCGGNYVDAGGLSANYPHNSTAATGTQVICPTNPGEMVTVTFTQFNTQANTDILSVYDGNSSAAPLLGAFSGTTIPPTFTSTAANGCLTFVFISNATTNNTGWLANVTCTPQPACQRPNGVATSAVTHNSVTVSWNNVGAGTTWHVLALPVAAPPPTAGATGYLVATGSPFVYPSLAPLTCYNIYVRSDCSSTSNGFSDWSTATAATTFCTLTAPPVCGGNFVDSGGPTGNYPNGVTAATGTTTICPTVVGDQVTVTFTAFALENNFDFLNVYNGSVVTPTALLGTFTGNVNPGTFTSSAPNGCLTFVFTSDGSVPAAGWIANITCGPPPTCAKPITLTAIVNSSTSATLNWVQPPNAGGGTATQWQVIVQAAGGPVPNAATPLTAGVIVTAATPAPPYTVTGLTPGTNYEFWVRAICSPTDNSPWGGPRPFFTQTSCGDSLPFCGNTGLTYTNTTGAPSYGNIGCLGTTPNPAWYFMQINQSGTLNFQIAQTNTAGAGIDVDFIAWGPFTPAQYATLCNNLYDYPDGNTAIPNNVVACSYSAAPIENFTINNAVSGNYYMILITNFSGQAGTVTFTQTGGTGNTNCQIVCSVTLGNDVILCPNATSHTLTATTQGATSYAWYFNGSTTPIPGQTSSTLVVTQAGNYTVVIQCGLNTATDTVNVSFGTPPAATISYAGSPYCKSITTPQNVTFTGSTGGTYSALPIGLAINSATGAITPSASLAGQYTVTYTIVQSGGCPVYTTTAPVEIIDAVVPTFNQVAPICPGDVLAPLPLISGNLIPGTWSPALDNTTTTTYTFTPANGVCATTATMTITVGSTTPIFAQVAPICPGGALAALPLMSQNNVPGTWSPDLNNMATTTYTFTPTPGVCATSVTMTIVVNQAPVVTVSSSSICAGDTTTVTATPAVPGNYNYVWTVPPGAADPGNVASFTTGVVGPYSVVISLVGTNTLCNTSFEQPTATGAFPNLINENLVPCWETTAADGIIEIWPTGFEAPPYAGTQLIEMNGNSVATIFQDFVVNPGTTLDISFAHRGRNGSDAVRVEIGPVGGPMVVLGLFTDPNGVWALHTVTHAIPATDSANYRLQFVSVSAAGGSPSIGNLLDAISVNVLTGCPSLPATGNVTLTPFTTPTFTAIPNICQNDTAPALPTSSNNLPTAITGSWFPTTIDTSVIGMVTYTFTPDAGQCASTTTMDVTIIAPTLATFNQIAPICQGGNAPALPTSSSNSTPITGIWNPATISTATAGSTVYTFTPNAGQCAAGTTMTIVIHPTPVLDPVSPVSDCDSYTLPALLVGNYFSSPNGVGPITNLTLTSSQLVYVYAQSGTTPNCTDQDSFQVTITPSPQFTVEGGCDGAMYVLEVIPVNFSTSNASYSWTGPNGPLASTDSTIVVNTAGDYTVIVTINGCPTPYTFPANDISCIIPKGVSPNGDGLNDTFDLSGYNVGKLSIFNRYGKTVYSRLDYADEWGGQSDSGNELPDGTYYYVIERKDGGDTVTGWVFINREN